MSEYSLAASSSTSWPSPLAVPTQLLGNVAVVNVSVHETVASFVTSTIKRHRTIFGKIKIKQKIHSLDDVLVVINVNNQRILRNNGGLAVQMNNYDMLWLVTDCEWKQFTQENLEVHSPVRHGKKVIPLHPNALTPEKMQDFIRRYVVNPFDSIHRESIDGCVGLSSSHESMVAPMTIMKQILTATSPTDDWYDQPFEPSANAHASTELEIINTNSKRLIPRNVSKILPTNDGTDAISIDSDSDLSFVTTRSDSVNRSGKRVNSIHSSSRQVDASPARLDSLSLSYKAINLAEDFGPVYNADDGVISTTHRIVSTVDEAITPVSISLAQFLPVRVVMAPTASIKAVDNEVSISSNTVPVYDNDTVVVVDDAAPGPSEAVSPVKIKREIASLKTSISKRIEMNSVDFNGQKSPSMYEKLAKLHATPSPLKLNSAPSTRTKRVRIKASESTPTDTDINESDKRLLREVDTIMLNLFAVASRDKIASNETSNIDDAVNSGNSSLENEDNLHILASVRDEEVNAYKLLEAQVLSCASMQTMHSIVSDNSQSAVVRTVVINTDLNDMISDKSSVHSDNSVNIFKVGKNIHSELALATLGTTGIPTNIVTSGNDEPVHKLASSGVSITGSNTSALEARAKSADPVVTSTTSVRVDDVDSGNDEPVHKLASSGVSITGSNTSAIEARAKSADPVVTSTTSVNTYVATSDSFKPMHSMLSSEVGTSASALATNNEAAGVEVSTRAMIATDATVGHSESIPLVVSPTSLFTDTSVSSAETDSKSIGLVAATTISIADVGAHSTNPLVHGDVSFANDVVDRKAAPTVQFSKSVNLFVPTSISNGGNGDAPRRSGISSDTSITASIVGDEVESKKSDGPIVVQIGSNAESNTPSARKSSDASSSQSDVSPSFTHGDGILISGGLSAREAKPKASWQMYVDKLISLQRAGNGSTPAEEVSINTGKNSSEPVVATTSISTDHAVSNDDKSMTDIIVSVKHTGNKSSDSTVVTDSIFFSRSKSIEESSVHNDTGAPQSPISQSQSTASRDTVITTPGGSSVIEARSKPSWHMYVDKLSALKRTVDAMTPDNSSVGEVKYSDVREEKKGTVSVVDSSVAIETGGRSVDNHVSTDVIVDNISTPIHSVISDSKFADIAPIAASTITHTEFDLLSSIHRDIAIVSGGSSRADAKSRPLLSSLNRSDSADVHTEVSNKSLDPVVATAKTTTVSNQDVLTPGLTATDATDSIHSAVAISSRCVDAVATSTSVNTDILISNTDSPRPAVVSNALEISSQSAAAAIVTNDEPVHKLASSGVSITGSNTSALEARAKSADPVVTSTTSVRVDDVDSGNDEPVHKLASSGVSITGSNTSALEARAKSADPVVTTKSMDTYVAVSVNAVDPVMNTITSGRVADVDGNDEPRSSLVSSTASITDTKFGALKTRNEPVYSKVLTTSINAKISSINDTPERSSASAFTPSWHTFPDKLSSRNIANDETNVSSDSTTLSPPPAGDTEHSMRVITPSNAIAESVRLKVSSANTPSSRRKPSIDESEKLSLLSELKVKEQQLDQEIRNRIVLEARLEETRAFLQILSSRGTEKGAGHRPRSATEEIDRLERSLQGLYLFPDLVTSQGTADLSGGALPTGTQQKQPVSPTRPKQQQNIQLSPARVSNNGSMVPVVSIRLEDSDDESVSAVRPATTSTTTTVTAASSDNGSLTTPKQPPSARKKGIIAALFGSFLSSRTKATAIQPHAVTIERSKVSDTVTVPTGNMATLTDNVSLQVEVNDGTSSNISQIMNSQSPPSSPDDDLQFSVRMLSSVTKNELSPINHIAFSPTPLKSPVTALQPINHIAFSPTPLKSPVTALDTPQDSISYAQVYFKPFLQAYFCNEYNVHDAPYRSVDEHELVLWTTYQLYGKYENSIIATSIRLSSIVKAIHDSVTTSKHKTAVMKRLRNITTPLVEQTMRQMPYTEDRLAHSSPTHRGHKDTSIYSIFNYTKYKWILRHVVPSLLNKKASMDTASSLSQYTILLNILKHHVDATYVMQKKLSYQVVFNQSRVCLCGFVRPQCSVANGSNHGDYRNSSLTSVLDSTSERAVSSTSTTYRVACKLWGVMLTERDIRYIKAHIWDRNYDQIRQIHSFYNDVHEPRHQGSGLNGYLLSYERCREMLLDFDVMPYVVDNYTLSILFQSCKVWEWNMAAIMYTHNHHHQNPVILDAYSSPLPEEMQAFQPFYSDIHDHHDDFNLSVGNFALTLMGFIELLTRIGCNNGKLSKVPIEAMNMLLHIMNGSNGTAKLANATRRSIQVRKFDVTK